MEWRFEPLGKVCLQDRSIVEPDSEEARYLLYLSLEHVESVTGRILREPTEPTKDPMEDEGRSTTFRFDTRHVLYGKLRPYLNKVALPTFEGRCTTELIPLLPSAHITREYLAWLLRRPQTVQAAMQEKTGSRMPRADMKHLFSLLVPVPLHLEDQHKITREIAARMNLVAEAKSTIKEQLSLLDAYTERLLSDFPCMLFPIENPNDAKDVK